MRTSKNRSSRARYTCAGWATGRSGWIAVLLCFISLFCSVLPAPLPLFTSRLIPLALAFSAPRPFLSVSAAAHSRELLFGCFITFINAAATMLPLAPSRQAFPLLVSTTLHCCSQKDANFNLILSNIIYAGGDCRSLARSHIVPFLPFNGQLSHIYSDELTPYGRFRVSISVLELDLVNIESRPLIL